MQGGEYNHLGSYYIVRANDAHAWVEAYDKKTNSWSRLDPTAYVEPERIRLGGQGLHSPSLFNFDKSNYNFLKKLNFNWIKEIELQLDVINYRFSLFMDNFNKEMQKILALRLKINVRTFYLLGLALLILVSGLFAYILAKKGRKKQVKSLRPIIWSTFQKRMNKKGYQLPHNVNFQYLYDLDLENSEKEFLDEFKHAYYAQPEITYQQERNMLKNLKSM
jgi:hypothetical protein